MADSEEKLGRLVSEFGRVCERRKLRVNVGKSKVMRCSRYGSSSSSSSSSRSASAPLLLELRQGYIAPKVTSVSHQHHTYTCHLNYSHIILHNSTMPIQIVHFTEINIIHCYSRYKKNTLFAS